MWLHLPIWHRLLNSISYLFIVQVDDSNDNLVTFTSIGRSKSAIDYKEPKSPSARPAHIIPPEDTNEMLHVQFRVPDPKAKPTIHPKLSLLHRLRLPSHLQISFLMRTCFVPLLSPCPNALYLASIRIRRKYQKYLHLILQGQQKIPLPSMPLLFFVRLVVLVLKTNSIWLQPTRMQR